MQLFKCQKALYDVDIVSKQDMLGSQNPGYPQSRYSIAYSVGNTVDRTATTARSDMAQSDASIDGWIQ